MNLGKISLPFKKLTNSHVPCFQIRALTPEQNQQFITYSKLIDRLTPYFTLPRKELVRFANCIFHEILSCIRYGCDVSVPYFGRFHGQYSAGRVTFNVAFNQYNPTPKVIQRCQPILLPSTYAMHICSPKNAFNDPAWYSSKSTCRRKKNPSSKLFWYENQVRFHKRDLMLYDNPYQMTGLIGLEYKLRESSGEVFPSETDTADMQHLYSLIKEKAYTADKKLVKRFVFRDFYSKNKNLWTYYNYLPGKYFVGADNNFYMTEKENDSGKTRYEVLAERFEKNKKIFKKVDKLPKRVPKDLNWDYFDMEQNDETTKET